MMKTLSLALVVLVLIGHRSLDAQESKEPIDSPEEDVFASPRQEAEKLSVVVNEELLELRSAPLYTYDDNVRNWNQGTTWIWGEEGRPAVALNLSTFGRTRYIELISFADQQITVTASDGQKWQPAPEWDPAPIPDAPQPAASRSLRLIQMRRLLRRFSAKQFDAIDDSYELRLLPQPIYRYEQDSDSSLDGAFFAFVREYDLEVILVIDAIRNDDGKSSWNFAFRTVSMYKQEAKLDGQVVWGH